ncbi:MAG: NAD(P)/FAD-dependent oxidoreductase [Actinomycetota bacterium]|nr:NAD(P)/FAD-dependent oxidoreductase [Actinomycetota bacterium]
MTSVPGSADEHVDVLVVGAGPAGLAASRALCESGIADVLVIDREQQAGGVPRHCHHSGFGIRDERRFLSGPGYANRLVQRSLAAGVRLQTETMATGWVGANALALTSPSGVSRVSADAVLLATGARERPRPARLVPGDRPAGVFTTGQLQQWWHLRHLPVGRRAIVVGAEHVSYSAVLTLREAGVHVVALVTSLPRHQTFAAFAAVMRWGLRVPVWADTEVASIRGHGRVAGVDLVHRPSSSRRTVSVDTVVFTGDWIPDNELARSAGVLVDASSKAPVVDGAGATSLGGVFAAGNLLHPGETADVAARRGAAVGAALAKRLTRGSAATQPHSVLLEARHPLLWCSPGRISAGQAGEAGRLPGGLIVCCAEYRRRPKVIVEQEGRLLGRHTVRQAVPNRLLHVPLRWAERVYVQAGPVSVRLG